MRMTGADGKSIQINTTVRQYRQGIGDLNPESDCLGLQAPAIENIKVIRLSITQV